MLPDEQLAKNADVLAIEAAMSNTIASLDSLKVETDEQAADAANWLRDVKGLQKRADELRKSITKPLDDEKAGVVAFFKDRIINKLEATERVLKRALVSYQQEQERIRREEQRKAEEVARKERERLAKRAAAAEAKGQLAKAETLQEQAQAVVAPVVAEAPKLAGIAPRSTWKFRITDPAAVPREYLMVDEQKIGKVVRALKADTVIAGVEVYEEKGLAAAS